MRFSHGGLACVVATPALGFRLHDIPKHNASALSFFQEPIMAFFAHSRPVADGVFGGGIRFSISDLFAMLVAWNDRRVTRRELHKLSDRELEDIGLCRAEIDDMVAHMR